MTTSVKQRDDNFKRYVNYWLSDVFKCVLFCRKNGFAACVRNHEEAPTMSQILQEMLLRIYVPMPLYIPEDWSYVQKP